MTRRSSQRTACGVVAEMVLDVTTLVDLPDESDRLLACAERPFEARFDSLSLRCDLDEEAAFVRHDTST